MSRLALVFALLFLGVLVGCGPGAARDGRAGVVLLRYAQGSESTTERERGFLETLEKEYPDINVLSSDQYSGTTAEDSLAKAQQVFGKFGPRVEGVFSVCEPNATGTLKALEETSLAKKVKFIGFDPNQPMIQAMADGKMHGIVLQDPVKMGYLAVKTMIQHLDNEALPADKRQPISKRVETGEYLATPENMQTPAMQKLLNPPQASGSLPAPATVKYRIAVIPKGTTHEFWKSVHQGAQDAAKEAGNVEILWKGPIQESERSQQIDLVRDFIRAKVHGICLAPLDDTALVNPVKDAQAAGIPTVIFDSGLKDDTSFVSYVATNNHHGGQLAARRLAELLGKKAKQP